MNIEKSIATLEVTEDNKVILRERIAVMEQGNITDDEGNETQGMVEKQHWFEQRTLKAGDNLSQESDRVKAVAEAVFGSVPDAPSSDPVVPFAVTKRQGRQQMIILGIKNAVEDAINSIEDETERELAQSFYEDSAFYERHHPQMITLAEAVGLTEEQIDEYFIAASKL